VDYFHGKPIVASKLPWSPSRPSSVNIGSAPEGGLIFRQTGEKITGESKEGVPVVSVPASWQWPVEVSCGWEHKERKISDGNLECAHVEASTGMLDSSGN
jgi:hypothetical protein